MRKHLLNTAIVLLMLSAKVMAQVGEPVLASVTYDFIYINDLNKPDQPLKEELSLKLGQNGSVYKHFVVVEKKKDVEVVSGPTRVVTGFPAAVVRAPGYTSMELFQHPKDGKMNIVASLGTQDYIMELSLPKIDWKISDETKKIGTYTCQKAVGKYAGRTYTAWFAPDLPFQNGPWKLSGLPGLILEATDAKKEVMFLFKDISKDTEEETTATTRRKLITVTEKAFNRAKEAYDADPAAGMQAQLPANGPAVRLVYRDASGKTHTGEDAQAALEKARKEAKERKDNPIELP